MTWPGERGVIVWNDRLLVYERRGGDWHAQYLGDDQPLPPEPGLIDAIEADRRHQCGKRALD